MKNLIILLSLAIPFYGSAQSLYFPPTTGNTWDTLSATSLGWCTNYLDTLDNYLIQEDSKAFILLKDGKIVHEKYFGTFTKDSTHQWNSAGKTMTAFAVGLAQAENKLNINDKTSDYLGTGWTVAPQVKEDLITVKNQLSMSCGLNDGVTNSACFDDTCLQYLSDAGTRWSYHNGPYTLLQDVVQAATGSPITQYLFQKLNSTTGIGGAFINVNSYNKVFFSKPRKMARFGLLMLNKGNWNGNQILTDTNYFNEMISPSQNLNNSYGYLWWLNGQGFMMPTLQTQFPGRLYPNAPIDAYAALGKDNQILLVVPSHNIVYVRMGNASTTNLVGPIMVDEIWQILEKLMCTPNATHEVEKDRVQVYPNPTHDKIYVSSFLDIESIEVLDLLGRPLQTVYRSEIDLSQFPSGRYFLKIVTKSNVSMHGIVKH